MLFHSSVQSKKPLLLEINIRITVHVVSGLFFLRIKKMRKMQLPKRMKLSLKEELSMFVKPKPGNQGVKEDFVPVVVDEDTGTVGGMEEGEEGDIIVIEVDMEVEVSL